MPPACPPLRTHSRCCRLLVLWWLVMSSAVLSVVGGSVGEWSAHLLSLSPQQLHSTLSRLLSSPSPSLPHVATSNRSRKRRRVQHTLAPIDYEAPVTDIRSGMDDPETAAVTVSDSAALVLPVSAEWIRIACHCCERLCTAQQQRGLQRRHKQPLSTEPQPDVCTGSPCVSYLCSLHLLLATHCVSLSACPSLLPLTLRCSVSHPHLIRTLLTATHDWSEAQIVEALQATLRTHTARDSNGTAQQAAEWRTNHTLSEQQPTSEHSIDRPAAPRCSLC